MAELTELPVQSCGLFQRADALAPPPAPTPDDRWLFRGLGGVGATAWVYYSPFNRHQLLRPAILSDGFEAGPSNLDVLWVGLQALAHFLIPGGA